MDKLKNNIYYNFNLINSRLSHLEEKLALLDEKLTESIQIERSHILRVKNAEEVSDEFILKGLGYYDLSPEAALKIYENNDADFLLLDVSKKEYEPRFEFKEAIKIPLEELRERQREITNKNTRILVISEVGVRSILACELLNKCGFYNINNISGGYKFWRGSQKFQTKAQEVKAS